jgi:PPOX class F420-dependent enzyme/OxyR family protein
VTQPCRGVSRLEVSRLLIATLVGPLPGPRRRKPRPSVPAIVVAFLRLRSRRRFLIEYLGTLRLGRVATAGSAEQPHVVPVSFRYNAEQNSIDIGGCAFATRKKYRDVLANPCVAFVVDDLARSELPYGPLTARRCPHAE